MKIKNNLFKERTSRTENIKLTKNINLVNFQVRSFKYLEEDLPIRLLNFEQKK